MSLRYLPNTATTEEIVAIIKEDGGVIIRDYLKAETLEGIRKDLLPLLDGTPGGLDEYFAGSKTRRLSRLFSRSEHMVDVALNPLVLEPARVILQTPVKIWSGDMQAEVAPDIQLGLTQAIQIYPGQGKQPLHRDDTVWLWRHPNYGREARLQVMVAISEFTKENGATHVIPGSHLWDDERQPTVEESVQAEMNQGDALLWIGSTYHSGGENISDAPRTGLTLSYDLSFLRQEENHYLALPIERIRQLPHELQCLLGWTRNATFLGWVEIDGQLVDPLELLKKDSFQKVGDIH